MKKKVLIIGSGMNAAAITKKFSETCDVYIAPHSSTANEFATGLDIREDSISELLDFVMENDIDLTIPVSETAIKSNITEIFGNHKQSVFAPSAKSSEIVFNKAFAKKTLYKLRIPTPKFGIFDKENMAMDYLKNQKMPCVIKTNESNSAVVVTELKSAKNIVNSIFIEKGAKVIIEDYVYGIPFSFYAITDGYKALPIGSSILYKHSLEGNGGQLTCGMGAVVPNYKISLEQEYYLMNEVIYPTLDFLEIGESPYLGILGINGIISDEGEISILGWQNFTQDADTSAIFEHIQDNLYELFTSCVIGVFSDEVDAINLDNRASVSVVLHNTLKDNKENIISGLDNLSEETILNFAPSVYKNKYLEHQISKQGDVLTLTSTASSVGNAAKLVYDEVKEISFDGIKYRKDIK